MADAVSTSATTENVFVFELRVIDLAARRA